MTEMIAAEPAFAERLLGRLADPASPAARLAELIRSTARTREPIVVVGCGTSEHGAQGFVEIVRDGLGESGPEGSIVAAQAFEAALEPQGGGVLIGIRRSRKCLERSGMSSGRSRNGGRSIRITLSR